MSSTERFIFVIFMALMVFNLLSTYFYLVGFQQAKAVIRKAFKGRQ